MCMRLKPINHCDESVFFSFRENVLSKSFAIRTIWRAEKNFFSAEAIFDFHMAGSHAMYQKRPMYQTFF